MVKSPLAAEQQQCSLLQQHFQVTVSSAGQDGVTLALLGMGCVQTLSSGWGEAELPACLGGSVVCVTGNRQGEDGSGDSFLSLASQSLAVRSRHP